MKWQFILYKILPWWCNMYDWGLFKQKVNSKADGKLNFMLTLNFFIYKMQTVPRNDDIKSIVVEPTSSDFHTCFYLLKHWVHIPFRTKQNKSFSNGKSTAQGLAIYHCHFKSDCKLSVWSKHLFVRGCIVERKPEVCGWFI